MVVDILNLDDYFHENQTKPNIYNNDNFNYKTEPVEYF